MLSRWARLEKAARVFPEAEGARIERLGPFLWALTEKMSPKERAELIRRLEMTKGEVETWQETRAEGEEAGIGAEIGAGAEAVARLPDSFQGGGR